MLASWLRGAAAALAVVLGGAGPAMADDEARLEAYAAAPAVWNAALSQTGRWIALGCGEQDAASICIYDLEGDGLPRLFPAPDGGRLARFYWANDTHLIVHVTFAWQRAVSDVHPIFRIDRAIAFNVETGEEAFLLRSESWRTSLDNVISLNLDDPGTVIMADLSSWGGQYSNEIYEVDLATGDDERLERDRLDIVSVPLLDSFGEVIGRREYNDETDTLSVLNADGEVLFDVVVQGAEPPVHGVSPDGGGLVVSLTLDDHTGLHRVDLETGEIEPVIYPGSERSDFDAVTDPWTLRFLGFSLWRRELPTQTFADAELAELHGELREVLNDALGAGEITLLSWDEARRRFALRFTAQGAPAQYFLYEREGAALSPLGSEAPAVGPELRPGVEVFDYTASDGLTIPAYLFLPPGQTLEDGPFPLIVMPHGGPAARDDARFDWWAQYYTTLGYAVFKPNFRGSTGYGTGYLAAGFGEFGDRMVQDVLDGVDHLHETGLARPGGYCAAGWSYGGYAALMLGLRDVDRVNCIIAIAPVTDPTEMVHQMVRNGEMMRARYWQRYVRHRRPDHPDAIAISPWRRAADFRAPILLIHGRDDTNVEIVEARQLERAMRSRRTLTYIELDDEDHFLSRTDSRRIVLRESEALLRRTLPVEAD